jgi:acetyl-CoA acetyltransferase
MNAANLHANIAQAANEGMTKGEMTPAEVIFVLERVKFDLLENIRRQTESVITKATKLPPNIESGGRG